MKSNKYAPAYKHVVHATEDERRERFNGCVSRQTLRMQLREEMFEKYTAKNPKQSRAERRKTSSVAARLEFQRLRRG